MLEFLRQYLPTTLPRTSHPHQHTHTHTSCVKLTSNCLDELVGYVSDLRKGVRVIIVVLLQERRECYINKMSARGSMMPKRWNASSQNLPKSQIRWVLTCQMWDICDRDSQTTPTSAHTDCRNRKYETRRWPQPKQTWPPFNDRQQQSVLTFGRH